MTYKEVAYPRSYVVWDLETTGLSPENDRIVEIGCMVVQNGVVTDSWSHLLDHGPDFTIPAEATAIHGITKEMCRTDGAYPIVALEKLVDAIILNGCCVTHNGMRFDAPFLLAEIVRTPGIEEGKVNMLKLILEGAHLDTAVFYKAGKLPLIRNYDEPMNSFAHRVMETRAYGLKFSIATCCAELGIDTSQVTQHRALGDVTLTNEIYKCIAL